MDARRHYEFATGVADSVSRVASLGLLAASGMVALGWPAIDLVFTGGRFSAADARECAAYFAVFSVSLFLWSAQAIYARAFYAAGNTFAPMVAGTIVTVVSLPIYAALYHWRGAMGLAIASDIGIAHANPDHRRAAAQAAHGFAGQPGLSPRWAAACWPPLRAARPPGCSPGASAASSAICPASPCSIMPATWTDAAILIAGVALWTANRKVGSGKSRLGVAARGRALPPAVSELGSRVGRHRESVAKHVSYLTSPDHETQ